MSEPKEIGAFEAKTHLSDLLRQTEQGQCFVILRRGRPVARLVPMEVEHATDSHELVEAFRAIRSRSRAPESLRQLIDEGRRH